MPPAWLKLRFLTSRMVRQLFRLGGREVGEARTRKSLTDRRTWR